MRGRYVTALCGGPELPLPLKRVRKESLPRKGSSNHAAKKRKEELTLVRRCVSGQQSREAVPASSVLLRACPL